MKSWKICHQFSIYGWTLGGTVKFEFEFAYKLHVAVQQKSLFTLKISVLSYRLYMNPQVYTDLVTSSVFEKLLEDTQHFILSTMSRLGEITSTGGIITSKGAALEVMSMEVPAIVLMVPRWPRPKPTPVRKVPKPRKYSKRSQCWCMSHRGSMLLHRPKGKKSQAWKRRGKWWISRLRKAWKI